MERRPRGAAALRSCGTKARRQQGLRQQIVAIPGSDGVGEGRRQRAAARGSGGTEERRQNSGGSGERRLRGAAGYRRGGSRERRQRGRAAAGSGGSRERRQQRAAASGIGGGRERRKQGEGAVDQRQHQRAAIAGNGGSEKRRQRAAAETGRGGSGESWKRGAKVGLQRLVGGRGGGVVNARRLSQPVLNVCAESALLGANGPVRHDLNDVVRSQSRVGHANGHIYV